MLLSVIEVVLVLSVTSICKGFSYSNQNITYHENVLLEDLFRGYNKQVRPVLNWSRPIRVGFGIALREILELDAKNQILITNVWVRQRWKDEFLTWNSSLYGGITSINIDPEYSWKPDILLYNNVQSNNNGEQYLFKTKLAITSDGTVTWFSTNRQATSCSIDIKQFPFDTQKCTMTFGPWTYTGRKLELEFWNNQSPRVDLSKYSKNSEFDLVSAEGKLNKLKSTCCPEPFYDITYTLVLKRKPLFYLNNLILPCIVLELVAGISFLFPPETGERISLVVTVLLGMTVFMIVFTGFIPSSSAITPMIGKYLIAVLFEVAACLLATSVPLRLYHLRPGTEMPNWMKVVIFDYLAFVLCYKCKRPRQIAQKFSEMNSTAVSKNGSLNNHAFVIDIHNEEDKPRQISLNDLPNTTRKHIKPDDLESGGVLHEGILTIMNFVNNMERDEKRSCEWKEAIAIIDRLFLWIFLVTFTASSLMLFAL